MLSHLPPCVHVAFGSQCKHLAETDASFGTKETRYHRCRFVLCFRNQKLPAFISGLWFFSQRILYTPIQSLNSCHVWMSAKCPNKNGENTFFFQPHWDTSDNYEIQFSSSFPKYLSGLRPRMKHFRAKCFLKMLWFIRDVKMLFWTLSLYY